jgi:surfeit locus 1 family protein
MTALRIPVIPTIIVTAAVAIMIALGVWQVQRIDEKAALLALYRANMQAPALNVFPLQRPVPDSAMFRRATVRCIPSGPVDVRGGKDALDQTIFRHIVGCVSLSTPEVPPPSGPEPQFYVDVGGNADPAQKLAILDFNFTGILTTMPQESSAILRLFRTDPPPAALLIAQNAAQNMVPSAPPDIENVPNDHLAYAIQWFLFAGAATIIYILALAKRAKGG